jgi:3-isopropylmalate/(R)-2-methylmalate dehydratase large subunit
MGSTLAEKILARKVGRKSVHPGEIVEVDVDVASMNELTTELIFSQFERFNRPVWDPDKITMSVCHFPSSSVAQATNVKHMRDFCREQGIKGFFPRGGPLSEVLAEQGYVVPNEVIMGTDSHTITDGAFGAFAAGIGSTEMLGVLLTGRIWLKVPPTIKFVVSGELPLGVMPKDLVLKMISIIGPAGANYKSVEYVGETITNMEMDGREVLASMTAEMGGKVGLVPADDTTIAYLKRKGVEGFEVLKPDDDAQYEEIIPIDVSNLEPMVACPHNPGNVKPLPEVEPFEFNQGFIGTCTGGRLDDMRAAARILEGEKTHDDVMLIIIPGTPEIYQNALEEGLIEIFAKAGAVVEYGNCGPCLGNHQGLLAEGEVCISAANRNFPGRMGSPQSSVYLASPATVAASSIEGKLSDPRKYL